MQTKPKKIDKTNISGLTPEKKEILKSFSGIIKIPVDLSIVRDIQKREKNTKIKEGEYYDYKKNI